MKKLCKKILSCAVAVCMVLALIPALTLPVQATGTTHCFSGTAIGASTSPAAGTLNHMLANADDGDIVVINTSLED